MWLANINVDPWFFMNINWEITTIKRSILWTSWCLVSNMISLFPSCDYIIWFPIFWSVWWHYPCIIICIINVTQSTTSAIWRKETPATHSSRKVQNLDAFWWLILIYLYSSRYPLIPVSTKVQDKTVFHYNHMN